MVRRFPHTLFVTTLKESVQDGEGNWTTEDETDENQAGYACRAEFSGGGFVPTADGSKTEYTWQVWGKFPRIEAGVEVTVSDGDIVLFKKPVKACVVNQSGSRIWL